jgi:hypothetical protein
LTFTVVVAVAFHLGREIVVYRQATGKQSIDVQRITPFGVELASLEPMMILYTGKEAEDHYQPLVPMYRPKRDSGVSDDSDIQGMPPMETSERRIVKQLPNIELLKLTSQRSMNKLARMTEVPLDLPSYPR